ncbi:unnamed protein product [Clonostachys rosea f. rosea IK726]|uniref:Rhodopsin domain-containing protein n=2 Tax=Bionectria ochroleuca TaxID=29856 RepID=A0A8H7NJ49_BIOOC|nr:unnamed protein product [Clonostachys rosea f. rosea IK726]
MAAPQFPIVNGVEVFREPPPGYVVDFENPQSQKVMEHYLIFGLMGPLALIALAQRYYTKMFLSKGLQLDDLFMFLGWMASVATQALLIASILQGGMCHHSWEQSLENFERYALMTYLAAPIYMLCNGFTKLSLLTFYLHISPQKWFRIAVWTSLAIVAVYTIVITLLMFFGCTPPQKAFQFKTTGQCINAGILYMATAVSNIITDTMLFVLPIPMIYNLHMPLKMKIGAIVVFGIGSITIATSVVRLVYLPTLLQSTDPSWDAAPADIWTFIEGNLFVICGSMPTLRKFFKHFVPRLLGSSYGSSSGYQYGAGGTSGQAQSRSVMTRLRNKHKSYSQFPADGESNEMQTLATNGGKNGERTVTISVADRTSGDQKPDDHSEKAILQTKSFTVQYGGA